MLFKKNEKKAALKQAIKAKRKELAERKKEDREWIDWFMKETDVDIVIVLTICIRKRAKDTCLMEAELDRMVRQYKTM